MVQQRTPIQIPDDVEGLLADLNTVQRERFSDRVDTLRAQGVEPGDAWQVSATQQRQADLPTYTPTGDEPEAIQRATAQLEGGEAQAGIESSRSLATSLEPVTTTDADSDDVTGDSGGVVQDEPLSQQAQQNELQATAPQPIERSDTPLRERRAADLSDGSDAESDSSSGSTTDSDTTTDDQVARAESILDNARQFLDTAIAAGLVNEATEGIEATNQNYVLTRDNRGVLTVENRETGGIAIGDENGVRESSGLTAADQQSWLAYSQVDEEQLQQGQRQRRRQQRQRSSELEL